MKNESAIVELYNQVMMNKVATMPYKRLAKKFNDKKDEFEKELNGRQRDNLDEVLTLCIDMDCQEMQEYFVAGFKLGAKLMVDTYYEEDT